LGSGVVVVACVWFFHLVGMGLQLGLGANDELVAHFAGVHQLDTHSFARGGLPIGRGETHVVTECDRHAARRWRRSSGAVCMCIGVCVLLRRGGLAMGMAMTITRMPRQLRPRQD
jgi:hypothetical protein